MVGLCKLSNALQLYGFFRTALARYGTVLDPWPTVGFSIRGLGHSVSAPREYMNGIMPLGDVNVGGKVILKLKGILEIGIQDMRVSVAFGCCRIEPNTWTTNTAK
jgi:hypothetical protein